ncbi:MAG: hydrolase [bacterium]|nr:hydrolase [bacterium]
MNEAMVFSKENTLIVIVDIQDKLADLMYGKDRVIRNVSKLIKVSRILNIPVVVTEQYPQGLGKTVPEIKKLLRTAEPIEKVSFSCGGSEDFLMALEALDRPNIVLTGMETHICVLQTALDLINKGYIVGIVQDAVCSYKENDMGIAMTRMQREGVYQLTTEMIIYEFLEKAGTEEFKALLPVLKDR